MFFRQTQPGSSSRRSQDGGEAANKDFQ